MPLYPIKLRFPSHPYHIGACISRLNHHGLRAQSPTIEPQALYDTLRQRDLVQKVELRAMSEVRHPEIRIRCGVSRVFLGCSTIFPTKLENICEIIRESLATDSLVELVATKLGLDVRAKSHRDSLYACVKVFRRHELGQDLVTQCSYIKEGTPLVRWFSAMPYGPGKCLITWYTLPAHQFHPCFLPPAATQWQHSSAPTRTAG